jgi:hypothetical protein
MGSGDPGRQRTDYHPSWLDSLADDVTMEGSVLNGVVEGAEAVRTLLGYARTLYEYQDFVFVGDDGVFGFVEDYSSCVRGEPIANIAIVRKNDRGEVQHLIVNHRPLPAVLLFSRLMGEHFKDTQYAKFFAAPTETI